MKHNGHSRACAFGYLDIARKNIAKRRYRAARDNIAMSREFSKRIERLP